MKTKRLLAPVCIGALLLASVCPSAFGALANCWHIPFNSGDLGGTTMRNPYVEISNNPASPTTVTVYEGIYLGSGANQTGGTLYYRSGTGAWNSVGLDFDRNTGSNQYWKASFSTSGFAANDVIQYYIFVQTDNSAGISSAYLYAPSGSGDQGGATTATQATAQASPYTIRNRPGWIFHANNRVVSGNTVQFWAKVGYVGDINNTATEWATNGAMYYTTDGSAPVPGATPGTSGGASTQVLTFSYDHPESNNQGSQSVAGTPMWWVATSGSLPAAATVKYKIGFWNSANSEQKFADHNAGTDNTTFSFSIGNAGDPVLTVNGVSANYTTTHVFVDEQAATSAAFNITFQPGKPNVTAAEVFTNLNRRERAGLDANGDGIEDGIVQPDGNTISAGDDTNYYKAYTMTNGGGGQYSLALSGSKTGAYRLTARFKVSDAITENGNNPNTWIWYSTSPRRDHAIVVTPETAHDIRLYEMNVLNTEASGTTFATRGTLEDLYDAPNAPHTGAANHWNLDYLKKLGCNWLWFQPIHPIGQEGESYVPGSPYAVRNFFEVNPLFSTNYTGSDTNLSDLTSSANRSAAMAAFQGFVSAADNAGVGVMLDAPFNHTAIDAEISTTGTGLFGGSATTLFRDQEARFYSRDGNYAMRASGSANIAVAPDRGDFGKWSDVRDVYFGRYAALVDINPGDNGNYLNEGDWFDYSVGSESSSGDGNGHFDSVTQNVWKYFANYTLYWLGKTSVPAGSDMATQTAHGIDGLRADFGQGLPPQLWEYIINKTRSRKWNFVFMAESLDGGAVTYRSNRHFDILNENIVFPLQAASTSSAYRSIFESRRSAYGQSLVLLNNMSHDEESYTDPWQAVVRYAVCSTVDGVPLIFPGQELGISRTFGYSFYETNFGKQIASFKSYNSMQPAWNDADYGNDQLYPVYSGIATARRNSAALRSSNRYFLDQTGSGGTHPSIFAVAKYETLNASPATSDVVFAFANIDRDHDQFGNFNVAQDTDGNSVNHYGIKSARSYNVKNIAAYTNIDTTRRDVWQWGAARTGSDILASGIYVGMNKVPTMVSSTNSSDAAWNQRPYEGQYLKLYDVTAPAATPAQPAGPNPYPYETGTSATLSWSAVSADSEGVVPSYRVNVVINGGTTSYLTTGTTYTVSGTYGSSAGITVQAVNPSDTTQTGPASASSGSIKLLDPNADEDHDGQTNAAEKAAGTNPLSSASVFAVKNVARSGGTVTVTWPSVSGKNYVVQSRTALTSGTWSDISGSQTAGTGGDVSYPDTGNAGSTAKFYRVRIAP